MNHYFYKNKQWVQADEAVLAVGEDIHWLDFTPDETDWYETVHKLTGLVIHENHIKDSFNNQHPPKCETGSDYEFLILPLLLESQLQALDFRACSFIFTDAFLITIRPQNSVFDTVAFERLQTPKMVGRSRIISSIPGLLHFLLNLTVNSQMEIRGRLNEVMESWQDTLMSRKIKRDGWSDYYQLQRNVNQLTNSTELQADVLSAWEKETEMALTEHQQVRFRDLREHLERVSRHLKDLRADSDNLLQIYFSITQEKTNRVVQVLTIISVIFLPLHLIAGLFGMNFTAMPLQSSPQGFWYILAGMVSIAALFSGLLLLKFKSA